MLSLFQSETIKFQFIYFKFSSNHFQNKFLQLPRMSKMMNMTLCTMTYMIVSRRIVDRI